MGPLFFLDYYATGKLQVSEASQVISGIADGCMQSSCGLIGGETAEMAGMYAPGEYDLAGFAVGAVQRGNILPQDIAVGDVLIGLPSSGVHSNGFSLVRKCVSKSGLDWYGPSPFAPGQSLAESLLIPTKIYVKSLMPLIKSRKLKGMAHITGGGLIENLPRCLPTTLSAQVDLTSSGWRLPPVFQWLREVSRLQQPELLRTFNCGIGMILIVGPKEVSSVLEALEDSGEYRTSAKPLVLGSLVKRGAEESQVRVIGELK